MKNEPVSSINSYYSIVSNAMPVLISFQQC